MNVSKNNLISLVAVGSLSSPLEVGADRAPQAAQDLAQILKTAGCDVVYVGSINTPALAVEAGVKARQAAVDAVALASASWFEDYLALDLLEEWNVPLLLWSLPGMQTGALCGTQQLTAYLKQLNIPFHCLFGNLEAKLCEENALPFLRACALKRKLRRARIGRAGYRVVGMTEVAANEMALKKCIGPRIVDLDLPQLLADAQAIADGDVQTLWQSLVGQCGRCEVAPQAGLESIRMYQAICRRVKDLKLDALTAGCYPHLMGKVCLAASLLADEGVVLGCEGDVNGAVGQLMLTTLTGQPTHNTDWLEPLDDGTVILTHCGSGSFTLAESKKDITLASVRLMGQGVCALFPAKPGPVTMVSLMAAGDHYQIALLEGEALPATMVFPGNPLRVKLSVPTPRIIDWIHAEGIGHHWMAGYGHVGREIRHWARLTKGTIRLLEL